MSTSWSWYVIVLVALNILGCALLLWWTSRPRPGQARPDDTSHVWDGDITEYNKPLPRWWIVLFYATIVYAIGYLFWYGGWGSYPGIGKWSSQKELAEDKNIEDAKLETTFAPYAGKAIDVIARDPLALKLGQSIFSNTCATCHGSSAQGAIGFPNLRDDIWKWGGTPDEVLRSVLEGREGVMPAWGTALSGMGGEGALPSVLNYVRSFSDSRLQSDTLAMQGKPLYDSLCIACHGVDGKGNTVLGAPDLTDDDWHYGGSNAQITESIANGRHGMMPAHAPLLGDTRARVAAAYVWSMSHVATAEAPVPDVAPAATP